MAKQLGFLTFFIVFALAITFGSSVYDPSPLQDFCVAVDEPENAVFVNGKFCKNPNLTNPDDFFFSGLNIPGNTSNPLGSAVTAVLVDQIRGLNTLGITLARIDYAVGGLNPPHMHPRAAEMLLVDEGTVMVGFVASNQNNNRLFAKILYPGDMYVFPVGMIHFELNVGKTDAVSISGLSSQNPGVITTANAIFNSDPRIDPEVLSVAFQLDEMTVEELQKKLWYYN